MVVLAGLKGIVNTPFTHFIGGKVGRLCEISRGAFEGFSRQIVYLFLYHPFRSEIARSLVCSRRHSEAFSYISSVSLNAR